ncbi:MAG: chromosomal replication initiator protein DnaA [Nitrospinaceae bacterium]
MHSLWRNCLQEIEKKLLPENFNTWFSPTFPASRSDGTLTIAVPNRFYEKCLTENYLELIHNTLEGVAQEKIQVKFLVQKDPSLTVEEDGGPVDAQSVDAVPREVAPPVGPLQHTCLNPKYTFGNFVVGPNSQFAQAACEAVANNPGLNYNPLFLYGAVGLGKTHLLHAIGNAILVTQPGSRVRYISAESFTIDLIESIKKDRMPSFRERYRPLDVLLVDDIQFIAGKERTQEEFFYTFNSLYEYHKQIIISSDRYPKDMQNIGERLRSRFESGLIADIIPPDLETKIAIIFRKAEMHQKHIPHDVAAFLAHNIKSNIRELEGLLLRVIAYASFTRRELNLTLAEQVLKDFTVDKNRNFTIPNIMKTVAIHFSLKVADLKSKKRSRDISGPRQIAMYICREHTPASLPEIGRQFGGKDHTTVIFSHRKISGLVSKNKSMENTVQEIIETIERG